MQKHQMKHNTIKDKKIYFPYLFIWRAYAIKQRLSKPTVDGLITLFELDASKLGAGILRFHGHNHEHNDGVITFRGKAYNPKPCLLQGLKCVQMAEQARRP